MWPLEFVVRETPKSLGSSQARRGGPWQKRLSGEAQAAMGPSQPLSGSFLVCVTYLVDHVNRRKPIPDIDNINKPIIDSMIQVVYADDSAVTDVLSRKRDFDGALQLNNPSQALIRGLSTRGDLLHVIVDDAPIQEKHL